MYNDRVNSVRDQAAGNFVYICSSHGTIPMKKFVQNAKNDDDATVSGVSLPAKNYWAYNENCVPSIMHLVAAAP
jgi:hypothetical protein